ncbi:hypothetical protein SBADM41S_06958 [Streptomyces badius]
MVFRRMKLSAIRPEKTYDSASVSGSGSAKTASGQSEPSAGAIASSHCDAFAPRSASRLLNGSAVGLNPSPRISALHVVRSAAYGSSSGAAEAAPGAASISAPPPAAVSTAEVARKVRRDQAEVMGELRVGDVSPAGTRRVEGTEGTGAEPTPGSDCSERAGTF